MITLFAIFYTSPWFPIFLIALLFVYIYAHHKCQPFKTKEANVFEYILMCCTSVVISIQTTANYIDSISYTASVVVALFIIIPILVVGVYVCFMTMRVRQNPQIYKFKSSLQPTS